MNVGRREGLGFDSTFAAVAKRNAHLRRSAHARTLGEAAPVREFADGGVVVARRRGGRRNSKVSNDATQLAERVFGCWAFHGGCHERGRAPWRLARSVPRGAPHDRPRPFCTVGRLLGSGPARPGLAAAGPAWPGPAHGHPRRTIHAIPRWGVARAGAETHCATLVCAWRGVSAGYWPRRATASDSVP